MDQKVTFRKIASEGIKNSHFAIKNCWLILFAGGTFALLNSFDHIIECRLFKEAMDKFCVESSFDSKYFLLYLLLCCIYLLTFYRFYVGNVRVFDVRYNETFEFIKTIHENEKTKTPNEIKIEDDDYKSIFKLVDTWNKVESIFLMAKTLMIIYLTVAVLNPFKFLLIYFSVLVFDIVWMIFFSGPADLKDYFPTKYFETFPSLANEPLKGQVQKMFPSYALKYWSRNNAVFALVIALIIIGYSYHAWYVWPLDPNSERRVALEILLFWCGAGAMLVNCLVDLVGTWTFYNPRYGMAHESVVADWNAKNPSTVNRK
jgi:hypothetical protein